MINFNVYFLLIMLKKSLRSTAKFSDSPPSPMRLALAFDYEEEGWPSMDLVGEMIAQGLADRHSVAVLAELVRPPCRRRFGRWPGVRRVGGAGNADRLLNRFWDYPSSVARRLRREPFDLFHIVDHSYSQLLHVLPADRTIVTCHDLDTFRCLLEPEREPRPRWFRAMAGRILDGFRQAAVVVCDSEVIRQAVLAHGLIPEDRLHTVPLGMASEFSAEPNPEADAEAVRLLGPAPDDPTRAPELLHVGTTIPRKRIDVLLEVVARVRQERPEARLFRVGGRLTAEQQRLAETLGLSGAIVELPRIDRKVLAGVYRRATLVLQPSEAEGFGLPVAEALACGAIVLASDLEVLREVGGDAVTYRPVADVSAWANAVSEILERRCTDPQAWQANRSLGLARASRWSWPAHVDRLVEIYRDLAGRRTHSE
ncbi:glycosyltransferase family 1 protein [soil metagenome]